MNKKITLTVILASTLAVTAIGLTSIPKYSATAVTEGVLMLDEENCPSDLTEDGMFCSLTNNGNDVPVYYKLLNAGVMPSPGSNTISFGDDEFYTFHNNTGLLMPTAEFEFEIRGVENIFFRTENIPSVGVKAYNADADVIYDDNLDLTSDSAKAIFSTTDSLVVTLTFNLKEEQNSVSSINWIRFGYNIEACQNSLDTK